MISEDERCRLAVNELKRLALQTYGWLKPNVFEKIAKRAKVDVKTLYRYIKEKDVIIWN